MTLKLFNPLRIKVLLDGRQKRRGVFLLIKKSFYHVCSSRQIILSATILKANFHILSLLMYAEFLYFSAWNHIFLHRHVKPSFAYPLETTKMASSRTDTQNNGSKARNNDAWALIVLLDHQMLCLRSPWNTLHPRAIILRTGAARGNFRCLQMVRKRGFCMHVWSEIVFLLFLSHWSDNSLVVHHFNTGTQISSIN